MTENNTNPFAFFPPTAGVLTRKHLSGDFIKNISLAALDFAWQNNQAQYLHKHQKNNRMSQAFVKEGDGQWLHDIAPTMNALINYLTGENNGVRVYETKTSISPDGKTLHHMSNGLQYFINDQSQWEIEW